MKISKQIGSSHVEEMEKILSFIEAFDVHKLLYAISEKSLDEDAIVALSLDIREQNVKLERQKKYLFSYTRTCNKKYALEDNKLVDSSARLSHKMRSGISGIKKTVMAFYKKSRRKHFPGGKEPQAIDKSLIATEEYMRDLFGLGSYPDCVKELFRDMVSFFNNMNECLVEARRSLSEEKEIREDQRRCLDLLETACEMCKKQQEFLYDTMKSDPAAQAALLNSKLLQPGDENPVLKAWVNSPDDRGTFASDYFHNCSPKDVSKIAFYETITEAEGDPNLIACMTLFGCGKEKARRINLAIECFDSLLPETCKRNKIPAIHLFVFMKWCSEGIGYETFLNYFNKRYKEAGGHWGTIGKSAISGVAQKAYRDANFDNVKRTMLIKLEKIVPQKSDKTV